MTQKLVTGTVRGRQGNRYLVVGPSGEHHLVSFEGIDTPRIGVDVIGVLADGPDGPLMRLVPDVTRMLLKGRARIIPSGRPDLTARMLAKLLSGMGPASIRPGTGGMIERTPSFDDPDVVWALSMLEPEAVRAGIALNVIDPIAMASSSWDDNRLKEEILPADTAGETSALADLRRLLHSGLTPACRRTVERIGRGAAIPSVDFVLPYSPFATGFSWCGDIARAYRNEIVGMSLSGSEARRVSTFRELALAFAPRYLGKVRAEAGHESHVENAFADVAAALAIMRTTEGGTVAAMKFQRLREAALARWDGEGRCPPATGGALAAALSMGAHADHDGSADSIFHVAASVARAHAPSTAAKLERLRGSSIADGIFIDLEKADRSVVSSMRLAYADDLAETVDRLGGDARAIDRMSRFGLYTAPLGLEDVFDAHVGSPVGPADEAGILLPDDPALTGIEAEFGLPPR